MDWIVFYLYRYLVLPLVFALVRLLSLLPFKNKFFDSLHFRIENKFHFQPTFDPKKKSIGVHAASGEIEYAYPLIRKIKETHPEYNIVVTLSSTSVLKAVMNRPEIDAVGPAPLDLIWHVRTFLEKFNFQAFLFARTDVWPEISYQLNNKKIPSVLFSATFSKSSASGSSLQHSLTRWALNLLTQIFTVSSDDSENLKSIQVKTPIQCLGDTRYDQVFYKKANTSKQLPTLRSNKKIFVAGSTWPEDENVVLPALLKVSDTWSFVIAPHEVQESKLVNLETFCATHHLKSQRLSKILSDDETGNWDVLIIDLYGYLFYMYSWAHLAFVGGSFKSKVHSVMEPLSFLKPVCVGPLYTNNREALEFSKIPASTFPLNWVETIGASDDLVKLLKKLGPLNSSDQAAMETELKALLHIHQNATMRTFEHIRFSLV